MSATINKPAATTSSKQTKALDATKSYKLFAPTLQMQKTSAGRQPAPGMHHRLRLAALSGATAI